MENKTIIQKLKQEYSDRARNNPRYSMRAFANFLGVDQSLLSKVLSGKRLPTENFLSLIGEQIPDIHIHPSQYVEMDDDHFNVVSDWYHFALLELIKIHPNPSDNSNKTWARLLDVTEAQVSLALERLFKLGYIDRDKGNWVVKSPSNSWVDEKRASKARTDLQRALLQKAVVALDEIPFEERDCSSLTVAVDPQLLPQIKNKIKRFRRNLDRFIESHGSGQRVYNLSIALFPISKIKGVKK